MKLWDTARCRTAECGVTERSLWYGAWMCVEDRIGPLSCTAVQVGIQGFDSIKASLAVGSKLIS